MVAAQPSMTHVLAPLAIGCRRMPPQVFDSYGKKCNSRFLLNYGFAVEVNRDADGQCHNEVRIMLSLRSPADDKHREAKVRLLNGSSTYVACCAHLDRFID